MSTITNPTKVITGPQTRWSYANVWNPKSINGGKPKYSVSLIIPKSDVRTVEKIKAAIKAAYEEGESKLKGNGKSVPPLSAIKTPLRDGDIERPDDETYRNAYFVNANSDTAPGIVDADRQPIIDTSEVYSGVLRPRKHQLLRLQLQRQQGHSLRTQQSSEDPRRRAPRRQGESGGRFRLGR